MANDNKRIAKNTIVLYGRMLFLMVVGLVTVRVVLGALGDVDYGISGVVGSVIYTMAFVIGTLSSASQRFFAYSLGRNDIDGYRRSFSMLLQIFFAFSLLVVLVGEAISPWVVTDWLNIPDDRQYAAKWVYQNSIFTFLLYMLQVPFTGSIVAHERMQGFAYISIADGVMKLGVAYLVAVGGHDRLILYSCLMTGEALVIFLLYWIYCRRNFAGCRYRPVADKKLLKELSGYTGWNLFGSISAMLSSQGQSILLNIFFGPVINAAKSIGDKLYNMVAQLSTNFYMAVSPQIVKSYAAGDDDRPKRLAVQSTRMSYFLLLLVVFPAIAVIDPLLHLWLKAGDVTPAMVGFSKLMLIYCLAVSLEQPLTQVIRATGKLKRYQLSVGLITLAYLPLAWLLLKLGAPAVSTMWMLIGVTLAAQIVRVYVVRKQVGFPVSAYMRQAIAPIVVGTAILFAFEYAMSYWTVVKLGPVLMKAVTCLILSFVVTLWIGVTSSERTMIQETIAKRFSHRK